MKGEVPEAKRSGVGCAWAIVALNAVLMGLVALSFWQGPYSSAGQEHWYRYRSLGYLLGGAILPAIALVAGAGRSAWGTKLLILWAATVLLTFLLYVAASSGGA